VNPHSVQDIQKPRLSREVARQLGRTIREGRYLPEQRLPPERQLSRELGVSRPVLREALSTLESQGYVEIRHGSGTFVVDVSTQLASMEPADWFREHWHIVRAFFEARLVVEPDCAALAARHASPRQLDEVRAILDQAEAVIARGEVVASIGLDIDFHGAIADMADNVFLSQMLRAIINPDTDLRRVLHRVPGRPLVAHGGHVRILAAIEGGDPEHARQEMSRAIRGSLRDIERLLEGGGPRAR
jgi:GntR family transcriptional regulator, transcriptional repressor for pyruvate dehydrogenase complex